MPEVNTFVVILADDPESPDEWIELQRGLEYDDQDRPEGLDTHCIVVGGGATHYGGVVSCAIREQGLEVELTPEAADTLDVPPHFRLELLVSEVDVAALRQGLKRMFEGDRVRPKLLLD